MGPVVPFPPTGGGHKRTLRVLEAIDRAGIVPHLVTADAGSEEGAQALRERGWRVDTVLEPPRSRWDRIGQHARRLPSPYLGALARRLLALAAERPVFVQFEHMSSAYYGAAAGPAPLVLSTHNADSSLLRSVARGSPPLERARWTHRSLATRRLERRVAPSADAVLCVSEADCAHYRRFGATTILAPNGVDDDLFDVPAEPPRDETVLFFGQFGYGPNADGIERFLNDGWPDLAARRPGARLRLVGGGLSGRLAALATGVPGVEVVGVVPSMAQELAAARLVLVPLWQGGGTRLKVLEALAAARPVVGTTLGVEAIGFEDGVHGRLAETSPGLARAAEALLAAPEQGRELGLAGRTLVERYRWRAALAETEALYRGYLERWRADAPGAASAAV